MTAPYTYTDRDGIPPLPEADGPGAQLRQSGLAVYVSAERAPEVVREILDKAGRDDLALTCSACGLAPADAETGPDGRCRHTHATKIHRRPATSHVGDTASGSASGSRPDLDAIRMRSTHFDGDTVMYGPDDRDTLLAEVDRLAAEVEEHRRWADHYREQRDAAWSRVTPEEAADYRRGAEAMREQAIAAIQPRWDLQPEAQHAARDAIRALSVADDEVPTLAELTDRVDAVEDHTDRTGYRIDELAYGYARCAELLRTLAAEVTPDDSPTLADRVATLERTIRLAATTAEVCSAEDNLDDLRRHVTARLDAVETRMLAVEQGATDGQ